ncbi:MAG: hypothetical protein Q8P46_06790 [Hyphomicrobiales bacterium]|nr:hypothetical protein [Hyphomicrobiales bacterium]
MQPGLNTGEMGAKRASYESGPRKLLRLLLENHPAMGKTEAIEVFTEAVFPEKAHRAIELADHIVYILEWWCANEYDRLVTEPKTKLPPATAKWLDLEYAPDDAPNGNGSAAVVRGAPTRPYKPVDRKVLKAQEKAREELAASFAKHFGLVSRQTVMPNGKAAGECTSAEMFIFARAYGNRGAVCVRLALAGKATPDTPLGKVIPDDAQWQRVVSTD